MIQLSELLHHLQHRSLFIVLLDLLHFNSFICSLLSLLHLISTPQIQFSQCSISFQWFTYMNCSFCSNSVPYSLFYWICISYHSFICLLLSSLYLIITTQIQFSQCSISFQWFTYRICSFCSNVVPCSLFYWICISFHLFHLFIVIFIISYHHYPDPVQSM